MAYSTATASTAGCQVSLSEYENLARDYLEDWDYEDALQAAMTDSGTTANVLDYTQFRAGDLFQVDSEMIYVSAASANPITVRRGYRRTQASAHGSGARILKSPRWTAAQIKDWINESFGVMYPKLYDLATTTLTGSSTDFDYDLPAAVTDVTQVEKVEAQHTSGGYDNRFEVTEVRVRRTNPPTLYIPRALSGFTLTVMYSAPFGVLEDDNDRTTIPARAKLLPVYYACARALEQKEAIRSRLDAYTPRQNEYAVREGQQLQTGNYYWKIFNEILNTVKLPSRGCIGFV